MINRILIHQLRHLKTGDEAQFNAVAQPLPLGDLKASQLPMPNVAKPLNTAAVVVENVQGDLNLADGLMDLNLRLHKPPLNVAQLILTVIYDDRACKKAICNKDPNLGLILNENSTHKVPLRLTLKVDP